MFRFRYALSLFLFVVTGLGFVSSAFADDSEIEEALGHSQVLTMMNLPRLPKKNLYAGFKSPDRKFAEKRVDIYDLLKEAQTLFGEKEYAKALAKLDILDATDGKIAEETVLVHRTRVGIAAATGDDAMLVKSLEAVIATNMLTSEEQLQFIEALASVYYRQKNYQKAIAWATRYLGEGGKEPQIRMLRTRSYYLNEEFAPAAEELRAEIEAEEAAGKKPTRIQLHLLMSAEFKAGHRDSFIRATEKTTMYFPTTDEWAELLNYVMSNPKFYDGLTLDIYRLMYRTGQLNTTNDYTDMAELAMAFGFAAEAKEVLADGYKRGLLGKKPDEASHKRLVDVAQYRLAAKPKAMPKDEAQSIASKDSSALAHLGYEYVTMGQFDKGIQLMEQAFELGGLKRPEIAKLHLGIAKALAGRNDAIQTLKTVQDDNGASDIARYWVLHLTSQNLH